MDTNNLVLSAPDSYRNAHPSEKDKYCNGCGVKFFNVPDWLGVNCCITEACYIHDWMYKVSGDWDRKEADEVFYDNMRAIVNHTTDSWFLRNVRNVRALYYYLAVRLFGKPHFKGAR